MNDKPSFDYLDQFVFCGLCFQKLELTENGFSCPYGCLSFLSASAIEQVIWGEMGRLLQKPKFRKIAERHLREKLTQPQIIHIFENLRNFLEFIPETEKERFALAMIEKVDILSPESIEIRFRGKKP